MKGTTTGWVVAGIGAAVTGIGVKAIGGKLGAGVAGYGLAHVVLGVFDMFRPSVRY